MKGIKFRHSNIELGREQKQYKTLPALHIRGKEGFIITCWKLSLWERVKVIFTGVIWMNCLTFNNPYHPTILSTKRKEIFKTEEDNYSIFKKTKMKLKRANWDMLLLILGFALVGGAFTSLIPDFIENWNKFGFIDNFKRNWLEWLFIWSGTIIGFIPEIILRLGAVRCPYCLSPFEINPGDSIKTGLYAEMKRCPHCEKIYKISFKKFGKKTIKQPRYNGKN